MVLRVKSALLPNPDLPMLNVHIHGDKGPRPKAVRHDNLKVIVPEAVALSAYHLKQGLQLSKDEQEPSKNLQRLRCRAARARARV